MHHGSYIGKIGLMIGNKQYILIGQLTNNFRAAYLQVIKPIKAFTSDSSQKTNEPQFNKQVMSERVSF